MTSASVGANRSFIVILALAALGSGLWYLVRNRGPIGPTAIRGGNESPIPHLTENGLTALLSDALQVSLRRVSKFSDGLSPELKLRFADAHGLEAYLAIEATLIVCSWELVLEPEAGRDKHIIPESEILAAFDSLGRSELNAGRALSRVRAIHGLLAPEFPQLVESSAAGDPAPLESKIVGLLPKVLFNKPLSDFERGPRSDLELMARMTQLTAGSSAAFPVTLEAIGNYNASFNERR